MFPYIGGKAHHINWMDPLFPQHFDTFVEVFGGAGWVSIKSKKITVATTRVYNDYNFYLANVFECFRKNSDSVLQLMNETDKSNTELFRQYQQELFSDFDTSNYRLGDVNLAVKYLYLQTQVFSGTALNDTNVPYFVDIKTNGKYPSKYDTLKKKLSNDKITNRLQQITTVENLDCIDLIKKYDSKSTFFYVDPPYYKKEFYYSKDFPQHKHYELSETLSNIQGKFALSYYDFDDLQTMYNVDRYNYHRQNVYKSASTRGSVNLNDFKHTSKGTEVLIMNY